MRALLGWALLLCWVFPSDTATGASTPSRYAISASAIEHDPGAPDGDRFRLTSRLLADALRPSSAGAGLKLQSKLAAAGGCVVGDDIFASGFETVP